MPITIQSFPVSDTSPLIVQKDDAAQGCGDDEDDVDVICDGVVVGTLLSSRLASWRARPLIRIRRGDVALLNCPKRAKIEKKQPSLLVMEGLHAHYRTRRPEWGGSPFEHGTARDDITMLGPEKLETLVRAYGVWFASDEVDGTLKHCMRHELCRTKTVHELDALEEYLKACWMRAHEQRLAAHVAE